MKCENCGTHIQGLFTHTVPTVRQDNVTGYTYRFCSEACASQWTDKRKQPPPVSQQAAPSQSPEEHRPQPQTQI
jgi:hypothetical protein